MSRYLSFCSQHCTCSVLRKAIDLLDDECERKEVLGGDEVCLGKAIGKAEHVGCSQSDLLDSLAMISSIADMSISDWEIQVEAFGYTALLLKRMMKSQHFNTNSFSGNNSIIGVSQMNTFGHNEGSEVVCDIEMKHIILLLQKASDMGYGDAVFKLGACHFQGDCVVQDKEMAVELFQQAADIGIVDALYHLGICYEDGTAAFQDNTLAFRLYKEAAEMGHSGAMFKLAVYYEYGVTGNGGPTDVEESHKWYKQSADLGNADARQALKKGHPYLTLDCNTVNMNSHHDHPCHALKSKDSFLID